MTSISTKTHPELTPAERRAERARTERDLYSLQFATIRLRRNSDAKPGSIRVCYVSRPGACYTVRLNRAGAPVHCDCKDFTRRLERDGAGAVEPCKHCLLLDAENEPQVPPCEEPMPVALQQWAEERLIEDRQRERLAKAEADRALWD